MADSVLAGLALVVSAGACADGSPGAGAFPTEGLACAAEVEALLSGWAATGEVLPLPGAMGGMRLATEELGRWVVLEASGGGAHALTLIDAGGAERVEIDGACGRGPAARRPGRSAEGRGVFTDSDLVAAVDAAQRDGATGLVVYVWSPHMPLSLDGWAQITAACEALGCALRPVLFPGSDAGFALREANRVGLPEEGLAEAASVELEMRDALVHAPTILVFRGRRVVAPVMPGYRDEAGYRAYLTGLEGSG